MTGVATGKEVYNAMKRIALTEGKIMRAGAWTLAYNYAWNHRFIKRMNDQERTEYKQGLIESLETERRANFKESSRLLGDILKDPASIQSECRKRIMQVHFQEMIDNKQES